MTSPKEWRNEAVLLLVGGVLLALCLGTILVMVLHRFHAPGFASDQGPGTILLATLSFHGTALLLSLAFLKYHGSNWRTVLGLDRPGLGGTLVMTVLALIVILPATWGLQALSVLTLKHFHYPVEDQTAVDLLENAKSPGLRAYLVFFAVILAPLAEEFVFRGVLYPWLKQRGLPVMAWLLPSFLFAVIHVSLPIFVPLFFLALALTWLYQTTGRLLANVLVHGLFNGINVILLFFGT